MLIFSIGTSADDITIAVADLTAAYTNALSGKGTFSHRARRVERYIRTFGFDRAQGVVVIRDRISISKPDLAIRWLLHTRRMPHRVPGGFYVETVGVTEQAFSNGTLRVHVLSPRDASISIIGGPGFEFFVDGRSYDDDGKVWEVAKRKRQPEPGAWRVEVRPRSEGTELDFLVVLVPGNRGAAEAEPAIEAIDDGYRDGLRITTASRDTRWWFSDSTVVPEIDIQ